MVGSGRGLSEHDYRMLANALPQIIWICDSSGRLEWINDRWEEVTGLRGDESFDKRALEAIHPDDHAVMTQRWATALATGEPVELEYRIRRRDGTYRWYLARATPIREDGTIVRWAAAAFDMQDRHNAVDALQASERRFETAFDVNPQPMAIVRLRDGCFVHVNAAFERTAGFARNEVLGQNVASLGLMTDEARVAARSGIRDHDRAEGEVVVKTRSGSIGRFLITTAHIDLGGERCLLAIARDVTEARAIENALRESEARANARADELSVLMDAVPAAVWITHDPECTDLRSNRMGNELLQIASGMNISKSGNPDMTRHFRIHMDGVEVSPSELPVHRAARGVEVRGAEEAIHFGDGQVVSLYGNAVPLRDPNGAPRGAIGAFVDVTRLKLAEAGMREADRRKDEFLALLSHELRNPLAPIIAAAELLALDGDPKRREEHAIILRQSRHLLRIVDDLLDVSRVISGKITLVKRPIGLASVISTAIEATAAIFEQRNHRLSLEIAPRGLVVDGDEVRLTQVISNLLVNAARFTPPVGQVTIIAAREGDHAVVRVRDKGVGLDAALLATVFDLFVQGPRDSARGSGGLGLGLSLVRQFTELHGGTVSAASEGVGCGSEFTVRLPALPLEVPTASPPRKPIPRRAVHPNLERILVVDDHRDAATLIARLLGSVGHDTRVAHDPYDALVIAKAFNPHVAILDLGLPGMDGYTLGRELKAMQTPPVLVALSGYVQDHDRQRTHEAGFAFHLAKPVYLETLVDVLAKLVG